jgi:hypothetical protein
MPEGRADRLRAAMDHVRQGDTAAAEALLAPLEATGTAQELGLLGQLRLQRGELDGALDVLVPGLARAEQAGAHRDVALLGLSLTQVLVAARRGLAGLRVLVRARRAAERQDDAGLIRACGVLAARLRAQVAPGRDDPNSRVVAAHLSGLLARAGGDLPRSRTQLRLAWALAGDAGAASLRAEVGLDLLQRQAADGDLGWRATLREARAAAATSGDAELVAELERHAPAAGPEGAEEPSLPASPRERARVLAERGEVDAAVAELRAALVAGGGDELGLRVELSTLLLPRDASAAASVLAPAWSRVERDGDAAATVAVGLPQARALAGAGQHQDAVRVLLVADQRAAAEPELRELVRELGAELERWLPDLEELPSEDAEGRAVVAATGALLAVLREAPDAADQLRVAWALAPAAGDRAVAQVGFDVATLGPRLGLEEGAQARLAARAAAERCGDEALVMVLDALSG